MSKLQPARGTRDLYGTEIEKFTYIVETARRITRLYGFEEMATPIFEFTQVFKRSLGDTTDIVNKEMYSFEDRGGESLTLRPEGTAPVTRALISNGLTQNMPGKYFYHGPMFRYERPQKGRYRQFHQVGVEIFGADLPAADSEVIAMAYQFLSELGVAQHITLELNTLGDAESRQNYRAALVKYLTQYQKDLSEDSQMRLEKNPLRILDSKDESDRKILKDAPMLPEFLTPYAQKFFENVRTQLDAMKIPFTVTPKLVRGLDYYCHTAFEFVTDALGAQGTVLGGGRYDGLVAQMGGPDLSGVGWGSGIERLMMLLDAAPAKPRPIALVPLGELAEEKAISLAYALRSAGFAVDLGYSGNLKKRMSRANQINASHALILGEDEIKNNEIVLRDLDQKSQEAISENQIIETLRKIKS